MGFEFAETMAGTMELDAQPGVTHPFRFEVTARADSLRAHLRDGKAELRGVIHAPPLATGRPTAGTITIRPVGQRIIRYELGFVGDDGATYELVGQKAIRWRAPRRTFSELPAEIRDAEHRRVAVCRTRFDIEHDLWAFLRSFRRVGGHRVG